MRRNFKLEKRTIALGLGLLVIVDVALAVYGWNIGSGSHPSQDLAILTRNRDLLRADIKRAQDIRQKIPAIQKDCEQFEQSLFPESTGYSSVSAELTAIAAKSGLQLESQTFKPLEVKGRGLTQVEIEAVVNGSYAGVVRFLNGMQRSNNMYAVQALSGKVENEQQGSARGVRVTLHIKTYFRAA